MVALLLLGYLAALPSGWLYASTGPYRSPAGQVPAAPVAIVLGAGLYRGSPSPFLAARLDLAAWLYRSGKVRVILVSGDNGITRYDEPTAMRDYLTRRQVPASRIVRDYAGFDTWDSCVRARRVFGVDHALVVTQQFHLPRAVALCRAAGIRAWGVGHDSTTLHAQATQAGYLREVPASAKAVMDVITRPVPRFLGPREPGLQRALDS